MYVGLLAGMIMLGLGGSSFTKDFAIRYLVYAFSVGMKLMALVMIAKIGSDVLIGLAGDASVGDQYQTALAIAGIAVVVFILAMYVPNIMQGVVQGASVSGGMEVIRHGSQAASFAAGGAFLAGGAIGAGFAAAQSARAAGSIGCGSGNARCRRGHRRCRSSHRIRDEGKGDRFAWRLRRIDARSCQRQARSGAREGHFRRTAA